VAKDKLQDEILENMVLLLANVSKRTAHRKGIISALIYATFSQN
jgi:hypothetical protein